MRKIVISTNLAETSITIDDCVFVVDAGRMKEKRFDPVKNMESLDTVRTTVKGPYCRIKTKDGPSARISVPQFQII